MQTKRLTPNAKKGIGMLAVKPGQYKKTLKFKHDTINKPVVNGDRESIEPESLLDLGSHEKVDQVCEMVWDADKINSTNLRRSKSLNGIGQMFNAPHNFGAKQTETGAEKFRVSPQNGGEKQTHIAVEEKKLVSDESSEAAENVQPMMMWDDDEKYIPPNTQNDFWDRDRPVIDLGNNCYG